MDGSLPRGAGQALDAMLRQRQAIIRRDRIQETRAASVTLYGFVQQAWHVLEPATPFVGGWAVKAICEHLEAITHGDLTRLLVTVPPGMLKSLAVSVLWPAWEWGPAGLPHLRYLSTSFSETNVSRDTLKMRRLVSSDWYQRHWGDLVTLSSDQNAKQRFENTRSGVRDGRSFTSLTGGRADRVIIDDPHSVDGAESDLARTSVGQTFREAISDRLNDPTRSAIVVIMQRLHERDLAGVILNADLGFEHLSLPMLFEAEQPCRTRIGFVDPRTIEGELLFPERFPLIAVDQLKASKGAYAFASQYQQRPAPRDGGMFKPQWFTVVDAAPLDGEVVRAWDLAATIPTPGRDPDWTVGMKVRRGRDKIFYIEHISRTRGSPMEVQHLVRRIAEADRYSVRQLIPQDPGQAGKYQADAFVRLLAGYNVRTQTVTGDKVTRANPASAQAEAGNIKLVRGPWTEAFLAEIATFPSGRHDDQVDAVSDAINALAGEYRQNLAAW